MPQSPILSKELQRTGESHHVQASIQPLLSKKVSSLDVATRWFTLLRLPRFPLIKPLHKKTPRYRTLRFS